MAQARSSRTSEGSGNVHLAYYLTAALLFRAGGYWWDGTAWYRPHQVWDAVTETYVRRQAPAARTVSAADMLATGRATPDAALTVSTSEIRPDAAVLASGVWRDHLALWAARRQADGADLARSVVTLTAPELSADQLIGVPEMARVTGIAASTLRAYLARGEADVPLPQAILGTRSSWSRPVAEEWAEQRRRSPGGLIEAITPPGHDGPLGTAELQDQFTAAFFDLLWDFPGYRKRWAVRWRTETAVRGVAKGLSREVAAGLDRIIPFPAVAMTIEHALIEQLADGWRCHLEVREIVPGLDESPAGASWESVGTLPGIGQMLGWLVRHDPQAAAHSISSAIAVAGQRYNVPRHICENTIRDALDQDSGLDHGDIRDYLTRVYTPESQDTST
jgi:predicted DNA-binding transcriptional regulator AlpA